MWVLSLLTCLFTVIFSGCGGPKTTNLAPSPTEKTIESIPDWFLNLPTDPNYLFATGSMTSCLTVSSRASVHTEGGLKLPIPPVFGPASPSPARL